jgi:hypothetical protein
MAGRRSLLLLVAVGTLTAGTLAEPRVSYGNQEPTLCPQKVLVKTLPVVRIAGR